MRTKLIIAALFLLSVTSITKAQCTMTITPTQVFGTPGTYSIGLGNTGGLYIQICSNVTLYDTLGSNQRKYYMMPGANLIIKGSFSHFVYMQGNASVTRLGTSGGTNFVYYETTATITGTASMNTTSCTAVSFPTISCSAGINEKSTSSNISVYPNPASDHITIMNDNASTLYATITNKLGQKVRSFSIENGNKIIETNDLAAGVYFLNITEKNKLISTQKIVITK